MNFKGGGKGWGFIFWHIYIYIKKETEHNQIFQELCEGLRG